MLKKAQRVPPASRLSEAVARFAGTNSFVVLQINLRDVLDGHQYAFCSS
jgi:hypothetical protein